MLFVLNGMNYYKHLVLFSYKSNFPYWKTWCTFNNTNQPRSKSMGRFRQEYTGSHRNMEAVFRPENFWIFPAHSDHFPALSTRYWSEIIGKNPEIFRLEYCFHVPVTSGVFLQDPAFFPSLSCRLLRDLVTRIFDQGVI